VQVALAAIDRGAFSREPIQRGLKLGLRRSGTVHQPVGVAPAGVNQSSAA
jgi:hypothetical protein